MYRINPRKNLLLFILLIAATAMPNLQASAALVKCRTDPIFVLSNGDTLNVTLDISTDADNVRNLTYAIHVPAGVTVNKVIYPTGGFGIREMYRIFQDSPDNTYTSSTVVTTQNAGSVEITATTTLNDTYSESVAGYNGQPLVVTVQNPW